MNFELIYWDHSYNTILALNLVIIIGLFTSLRLFSGTISHIDASDELLKKDNPAFGISLAGATFALAILLSGTIYGDMEQNLMESAISVGLYGIIGIILMAVTRVIFDKVALPKIILRDEIAKGNIAVAIADAANVIATSLIIRAVMVWIDKNSISAIGVFLAIFAISQIILTLMTVLNIQLFKRMNKGRYIQDELLKNNKALALSFAGKKIATALAITIASELVVYEIYDIAPALVAWVAVSLIFIIILKILSYIAEKIILFGINTVHEIVEQKNIAIGALKAVIYISMGILLAEI